MGGGSDTSQSSNSKVTIPQWLKPLLTHGAGQEFAAMGNLPSLSALYGMVPQQGVAPLTAAQLNTIGQYQGLNTGANSPESAALGTLGEYSGGAIGQDPATQAALAQFGAQTAPSIAQNAALQGQGNSGAALEAQAMGRSSVLAPFLENAQNNQLNAANAEFGAGNSLNNQTLNTLQAQLQAEGIPQEQAQQIANSLYQQQSQQFNYAQAIQNFPLTLFGNTLGSETSSSGATSQNKF